MGILNGETRLLFCLPSEWSKMENWEGRPKLSSTPIFTYVTPATCNTNCKRNCGATLCKVTDASSVSLSLSPPPPFGARLAALQCNAQSIAPVARTDGKKGRERAAGRYPSTPERGSD